MMKNIFKVFALIVFSVWLAGGAYAARKKTFHFNLAKDGKLYAGAGAVDITPKVTETFTDLNNNAEFDGVLYKPDGDMEKGKPEPFHDVNGNHYFDAVWLAGYGTGRAAQGVHDPLYARSLFVAKDDGYVIFVALDLVGFMQNRIEQAKEKLKALGIDPDRVVISSTHNHEGPDTLGLWGAKVGKTGINAKYQEFVVDSIVEAVKLAVKNKKAARVKFASVHTRELNPYFNGKPFGGKNIGDRTLGLISDLRDPVFVDDLLNTAKFDDVKGETIATLVQWTSHPEISGDNNMLLTSDYPGVLRKRVEKEFGGTCVYQSGDVGGMMTTLGRIIPLVDEKDAPVYEKDEFGNIKKDEDGMLVPVYAGEDTLDAARSLGFHLANGVIKILKEKTTYDDVDSVNARALEFLLPIENEWYNVAAMFGVFEIKFAELPQGKDCVFGCIPAQIYHVKIGPAEFVTVPGEALPEVVVEPPEDFVVSGGRPNKYFPQHDVNNPLSQHADPFALSLPPIRKMMTGKYKFIIGLAGNEIGYIVPPEDFNHEVKAVSEQGDHYEETNSLGPRTAGIVLGKIKELLGINP